MKRAAGLGLLFVLSVIGCASYPGAPPLSLQRSLYPGLGDLDQRGIEAALAQELEIAPPISAGLVWLSEAAAGSPEARTTRPITEYARTGVLEEALTALRQDPFGTVSALPTIPNVSDAAPSSRTLDALRSASARFQYDVALLLQTGTAEDMGLNPFALGYLGLVTIPMFPGHDVAASSSAELCAIDVRSGIMLGCARGRAQEMDRVIFLWQENSAQQRLAERTLRASVAAAAKDLLSQISPRFAGGASR